MSPVSAEAVFGPNGRPDRWTAPACASIPVSLAPLSRGMTGALYAGSAVASGLAMLYFGARMGLVKTLRRAHELLLGTVIYLPALH